MENVQVLTNAVVQNALTHLRDKNTSLSEYRTYSNQLCHLLLSEAMRYLPLKTTEIESPIEKTQSSVLDGDIVILPIFRAGLAMLSEALQLLPHAKIGFAGLARDEATAIAHEYYWKMPDITHDSIVLITDPMLATGGSVLHVIEKLKEYSPKEICLVCVIAAPEGITAVHSQFPEVRITTAAVDEKLNDKKYIVPGLGDYGDRYFGTE